MKRKFILIALLLVMSMASGCGSGDGDGTSSQSSYSSQSMASIETQVDALSEVRNRAITNPGSVVYAQATVFFAGNFGIDSGYTRDERINNVLNPTGKVATISSASNFEFRKNSNDNYYVHYVLNLSDGSRVNEARYFIKEGSEWKIVGNGRHSSVSVYPKCIRGINYDGSVLQLSGLYFGLDDHGNYDLQTAVVTGPGLPAGGLTFTNESPTDPGLYLDYAWRYHPAWSINLYNFYAMSDDVIGAIPDGAQYTIKFFKSDGRLAETRTATISRRPYKVSELDASYFPSTTLSNEFSDINFGGAWDIKYSKPTAGELGRIYIGASIHNSNHQLYFQIGTDLPFDQTSYAVHVGTPSFTPHWGYLAIRSQDLSGRMAELQWIFN